MMETLNETLKNAKKKEVWSNQNKAPTKADEAKQRHDRQIFVQPRKERKQIKEIKKMSKNKLSRGVAWKNVHKCVILKHSHATVAPQLLSLI